MFKVKVDAPPARRLGLAEAILHANHLEITAELRELPDAFMQRRHAREQRRRPLDVDNAAHVAVVFAARLLDAARPRLCVGRHVRAARPCHDGSKFVVKIIAHALREALKLFNGLARLRLPRSLRALLRERRAQFQHLAAARLAEAQRGDADAYVAQYMARMEGRAASSAGRYEAPKYFEVADVDEDDYEEDDDVPAVDEEAYAASQKENEERARASVEAQKEEWARWSNSEDTTLMWQIVSSGEVSELEAWLKRAPGLIHLRAEDGRGPLWWAYEYDRPDMVALLVREGADPDATDSLGMAPREMAP